MKFAEKEDIEKAGRGIETIRIAEEFLLLIYLRGEEMLFNKGDIVVAKDGFLNKNETLQDTAGIVIDHNPENDYLVLGTLHPEKYAVAPTFSMRGEYYRHATEEEMEEWEIE